MLAKDLQDLNKYEHYSTVQELLDFIEKNNIDKNSKILVQRIEDMYYEQYNWTTIKKDSVDFADEQDEFTPVWCPVKYKDDDKLYLHLHH